MTNPRTVAVHGATGSQGRPVVDALLARGHRVRALARDPQVVPGHPHVDPVPVDLRDPRSLTTAYAGADAVVVQLPLVFHPERALQQAAAVAEALGTAGVRRVVFNPNTALPAAPVGHAFVDSRVQLRGALDRLDTAALTIGPAAPYAENLLLPVPRRRVLDGVLAYPLPSETPVPWLAAADLAGQIADAIATDETGAVALAGPHALRGSETAAAIAAAVGRPLRWHTVTPEEYERMLLPTLGPEAAAGIAAMYAPRHGEAPEAPSAVRRGITPLSAWALQQDWPAAAPGGRAAVLAGA